MTEEYLDVLTPEGEPTHTSKPRDEVHRDGLWHASIHVWIVDGNQVLLQKRSETKESFPGLFDVSSSGHVRAGETPVRAAVRETAEEVGLTVSEDQLIPVAVRKLCVEQEEPRFVSNEYNYVYLILADRDSWNMRPQAEEVDELRWMGLDELYHDLKNSAPGYCIEPEEEELILKLLSTSA